LQKLHLKNIESLGLHAVKKNLFGGGLKGSAQQTKPSAFVMPI